MLGGAQRISLLLLISAHALVLCGLICVVLTGEVPAALWVLALAAHPLSTLSKPSRGRYFFNMIVLLALSYSLFLFFVLQTPFLVAFTQFLIVVQAVKLFHLDSARDYFQLAGLSLLTVLAAAGLTSQLYYLFFLFALLLIGIWFLFLLHLKRDMDQHTDLPAPPRSLTAPSLFLGITGIAACSFIITIIIFFTLPRISLSVSGREQWSNAASGFSETVDLGNVGPVRLDSRVIMRVEIPQFQERPPSPLYWRGTSFASWNGQAWEKGNIVENLPRRHARGVSFERPSPTQAVIDQTIMLEPMGTDLLFFLNPPLEIRGRFSHLLVDQGDGIHLPSIPRERYYYEVTSAMRTGKGAYPPLAADQPEEAYLQLPEKKKEIVALAREIVAGAEAPEVKAERMVSYLKAHYTYSLNPKRDRQYLPLDDFLLHSREGYCEHFATAAALLLRATGVPTRLVSGFLEGEWNALGRYFMVRQRDAHTWIEVSVPGKGWILYDPTPAAASSQPPSFLGLSLYRYYDFLKLKWNRYIVQYTRRDQIRFLLTFRQAIMSFRLFPQASLHGPRGKNTAPRYFFAALAGIALAVLLVWMLRQKKKTLSRSDRRLPADIYFYAKMLKILEKKKIKKRTEETPAEFAARTGKQHGAISPRLQRITSLYYQVRFGLIPLSPFETAEVDAIIKALQKIGPIHQKTP